MAHPYSVQGLPEYKPRYATTSASVTIQFIFRLDVAPHEKFAKVMLRDEDLILVDYVFLWMTLVPEFEKIPDPDVMFMSEEKKEGDLVERSRSDVFLSTGDKGIKKGEVLTLKYNCHDETCLVTLRTRDPSNASINANKQSQIMSFHIWCKPRGTGTRDLVIQDGKQTAVELMEDRKDIYLDLDLPEHDEESGGVRFQDVETLYEELADLKFKGRL